MEYRLRTLCKTMLSVTTTIEAFSVLVIFFFFFEQLVLDWPCSDLELRLH